MTRALRTLRRRIALAGLVVGLVAIPLRAADPPDFKPDATFTGSALTGWRVIGQADWQAQNGELVARGRSDAGGWLVMDKPLQDLQFFANVRCDRPCRTGVLLRNAQGNLIPALGKEGVLTVFYGNPRQVFVSFGVKF